MAEKILIVDDDLDTLRLVGLLLQRKGYQISAADNGKKALEKAQTDPPDLILLDVMMPEMDGLEVLRKLRTYPVTADVPVILFTAKSQVEDKVTGFDAGADDYLTKPTHPAELIARVRVILARSGSRPVKASGQPVRKRGRTTCLISAKGGMGVTTAAINLAIALRKRSDKKVVLIEMRPGTGSAEIMLKLPTRDALSVLLLRDADTINETVLQNALQELPNGLNILPASFNAADARLANAEDQMAVIVDQLAHHFDHVIIDLGAGLPPSSIRLIEQSDHVLVVLEPISTTILQTRALLEELRMKVLGLGAIQLILLSRAKLDSNVPPMEIQSELGHKLAAVIPPVPEIAYKALEEGVPIIELQPNSTAAHQFKKAAELLDG